MLAKMAILLGLFSVMIGWSVARERAPPSTGLYFTLNGKVYLPGDTILITDIGSANSSDPGSSLVCVTTNVNTNCCRTADGRSRGEWLNTDGTRILNTFFITYTNFYRTRHTQQVRLNRRNNAMSPIGVFTCVIPDIDSTMNHTASINIISSGEIQCTTNTDCSDSNTKYTKACGRITCTCNQGYYWNNTVCTSILSPIIVSSHLNSSTSIRLRWNESATPVDWYIIRYYYTIRECAVSRSPYVVYVHGSRREYIIYGLEKNSDYTISITARKQGGESLPTITRVGTTPISAPPAPSGLIVDTASINSSTSLTIIWRNIPCMGNTDIHGYYVSYGPTSYPTERRVGVTGVDNRIFTASGLIPMTNYTFQVYATHINLTLQPPLLYGPPATLTAVTEAPEAVEFYLNGELYPNNSVVAVANIGENNNALFCLTDSVNCCRSDDTGDMERGLWVLPDGSVPTNSSTAFYINRSHSAVLLNHRNNEAGQIGLFTCKVPDNDGVVREIYIGVNLGAPVIVSLKYDRISMTLTCTSSGGPVDSVTWLRNGVKISRNSSLFSQTQTIMDTVSATYQHTLSSRDYSNFVGNFTCQVRDGTTNISRSTSTLELNGVIIISDPLPFTVGNRATATCSSDSGVVERIEWRNNEGGLLVSATSVQHLTLALNPVSDSHGSEFICFITRNDEFFNGTLSNKTLLITVTVPSDPISATVIIPWNAVAGSEFTMSCTISETSLGLTNMPTAKWFDRDYQPVTSGDGVSITTVHNSLSSTSNLTFNPLRATTKTKYICAGNLTSPALETPLQVMTATNFTIQICAVNTYIARTSLGNTVCQRCPLYSTSTTQGSKSCDCLQGFFRSQLENEHIQCSRSPSACRNLRINQRNTRANTITVMWERPLITGRTDYYYNIHYSDQDMPENFTKHNLIPFVRSSYSLQYSISNLRPLTNYTIRVTVHNGVSDQDPNEKQKKCEVSATTGDLRAQAPRSVASFCSVIVWKAPPIAYGVITGYQVSFSLPGNTDVIVSKERDEFFHVVKREDLPTGEGNVTVQVRARTASINGAWSSPIFLDC